MERKKIKNNPMHKAPNDGYKFMQSPRCGAKTRKKTPCLSPAVRGKKRCRMHGGAKGTGAPYGNKNALTHGFTTRQSIEERRSIKALLKECDEFFSLCHTRTLG